MTFNKKIRKPRAKCHIFPIDGLFWTRGIKREEISNQNSDILIVEKIWVSKISDSFTECFDLNSKWSLVFWVHFFSIFDDRKWPKVCAIICKPFWQVHAKKFRHQDWAETWFSLLWREKKFDIKVYIFLPMHTITGIYTFISKFKFGAFK